MVFLYTKTLNHLHRGPQNQLAAEVHHLEEAQAAATAHVEDLRANLDTAVAELHSLNEDPLAAVAVLAAQADEAAAMVHQ
jgi:cell division protein FtsB